MVNPFPPEIDDRSEESFPEPTQWSTGVIGAKLLGGLNHNDADAHRNRKPGAQPELEAAPTRAFFQFM